MQFSKFGEKFTQHSGILQLMDDLGQALLSDKPVCMLGGGNPARIEPVQDAYRQVCQELFSKNDLGIEAACNYSTPQGDAAFIQALCDFFNQHYGWRLHHDNIALCNGSQNAFFYLFNLFAGTFEGNGATIDKSILLPLAPEYVGYADVQVDAQRFMAVPPRIDEVRFEGEEGFFKYRVDFQKLEQLPALLAGKIGAICCSRPSNPSGNVLTDREINRLDALAQRHRIPLIIDNAYGMPFPNILYSPATLNWHENIILCFSLSKLGLPGLRTGMVVAAPQVIRAISSLNAIINLAPTRFGATIATPLLRSGRLKTLADEFIRPFYADRIHFALHLLREQFRHYPVAIHQPEGAIFLWLWMKNLPISSHELYLRLKERGTLIIPGESFFIGMNCEDYPHAQQCIRLSIAQDDDTLRQGIHCIGEVVRELYDSSKT